MNKSKKAQSGKRTTRKKQKHLDKKAKRGGATSTSKRLRPLASAGPRLGTKSRITGNENSSVNSSNNNSSNQDSSQPPSLQRPRGTKTETHPGWWVGGLVAFGLVGVILGQ